MIKETIGVAICLTWFLTSSLGVNAVTPDNVTFETIREKSQAICDIQKETVECKIDLVLKEIGEEELSETIYKLAWCENRHREAGDCGDSGKSCGFLQFRQPTWELWKCEGDRFHLEDSVICGTKLINAGVGHLEAGWMNCWRKAQLPIIEKTI